MSEKVVLRHVKIYADGADLESMVALAEKPHIAGFTTNPTLMRKSGVSDYEGFARKVLETITDHPISFEVFADDAPGMLRQARLISSWGPNVYVKIPVTDTKRNSMADVVAELTSDGVQLNVTALMTVAQVETVTAGARRHPGGDRIGLRRSDRRHRPRPDSDHDFGPGHHVGPARRQPAVGQPPGDPQRPAGRRHRRGHHYGDPRHAGQAVAVRQRPRRLLAGHGEDVRQRRPCRGVQAVTDSGWQMVAVATVPVKDRS